MYDKSLVKEERLALLKVKRDEMRAARFEEAEAVIGADGASALKELYALYDQDMYLWLAGLWEPEIGAFYYSNSGRDTEGFLPDIESTVQAMCFLDTSGLISSKGTTYVTAAPQKMKDAILGYAKGLQDPDGFFYHPQWGKDISVSRRGRDLSWARRIIREFGGTTNYPTPADKKSDGDSPSELLPDHLKSVTAFKAYLSELDLAHRSYSVGNLIQSQTIQIKAAGEEIIDTLFNWYETNQNPENGLWEEQVNYASTNGLMKVALAYTSFGRRFPNAEQALKSAIKVILDENPDGQITSFYNPWITLKMLIDNLSANGEAEKAEALRKEMVSNSAAMIRSTATKVARFRKVDGSFSYGPNYSSATSQGAPVATPKTNEGDVNGNCLASTGVARNVCQALGIKMIPFFTKEDSELFFELIDASYPSTKIYPATVIN